MPKRPWNRVNQPVYSISSYDGQARHNMNLITYVTPVSMVPKLYLCGIYHGTKTLELVTQHHRFVLQLLAAHQYRLTELLGKTSGHAIDKISRLNKRELTTAWNGYTVLKECLAVIELKVMQEIPCGDHTGFVCEVVAYKNRNEGSPLTLDILREHKLVRM